MNTPLGLRIRSTLKTLGRFGDVLAPVLFSLDDPAVIAALHERTIKIT